MFDILFLKALFVVAASGLAASGGTATGLRYEKTVFDLGKLQQDTTQEVRLVFHNPTGDPIELSRVYCNCGCLELPETYTKRILPDEKGSLVVSVKTGFMAGDLEEAVFIADQKNRVDRIDIRFSVTATIRFSPARLQGSTMLSNKPFRQAVKILGSAGDILSCKATSDRLAVHLDRAAGTIMVEVVPKALGHLRDRVEVTAAVPGTEDEAFLEIPVDLECSAPIRIYPRILNFGLVAGGSVVEKRILISNLFPEGYQLKLKAVTQPDCVQEWEARVLGETVEISLVIRIPAELPVLSEELSVHLDDAQKTRLKVGILGIVRGRQ